MLKLEIKLDEDKILAEQKYTVESIYQALEQAFAKYRLKKHRSLMELCALSAMETQRIMVLLDVLLHH